MNLVRHETAIPTCSTLHIRFERCTCVRHARRAFCDLVRSFSPPTSVNIDGWTFPGRVARGRNARLLRETFFMHIIYMHVYIYYTAYIEMHLRSFETGFAVIVSPPSRLFTMPPSHVPPDPRGRGLCLRLTQNPYCSRYQLTLWLTRRRKARGAGGEMMLRNIVHINTSCRTVCACVCMCVTHDVVRMRPASAN